MRIRALLTAAAVALLLLGIRSDSALADSSRSPSVELNTDAMGPRTIEDLTRQKILHDYSAAWRSMAIALEANRPDLLNDYFTGFAKKEYSQAIDQQSSAGIRRRYADRGHKLEGVFYSPDGGVMELRDTAQLDEEIFDGEKLLNTRRTTAGFIVVMTPAADRWMVRLLQPLPAEAR